MTIQHTLAVWAFKAITSAICRIHPEQLVRVPLAGPMILVMNHVNLVEIPILYTQLQPRPVTGMVAHIRWNNGFTRWLLEITNTVPVHRGEGDTAAIRRGLAALAENRLLLLAPEGTRSYTGQLQRGLPGAALLALHSGAPILPVVFYGAEHYVESLKRLKRSDFHIVVGQPFYLTRGSGPVHKHTRQQMIDEVMFQMAALLPEAYRGVYANLDAATTDYIEFLESPDTKRIRSVS